MQVQDFDLTSSKPVISATQVAAYSKAKNCPWLTLSDVQSSTAVQHRVLAFINAGSNPMEHHRAKLVDNGLAGAAQTINRITSPEKAKFIAGEFIRKARENRLLGGADVALALSQAARYRKAAKQHIQAAE
ncbi:hypothetical protein TM1040_1685 [Ruegeria sp. TM1040]|uniref:hypothetical protein n=1 Tax=Ruegeria sp. (strain TM1040) TaxID=292414 RepID=UPI0000557106|nr:hypothetical protein [Ruegeria sp. TM1040]ABF64418.1 hypothetical protein TM1040_1685 [Ruegeria sp. TM1040]